ncbi:unnamed protein product [Brassica rapa]|uniref:Glucose-6-phosphate isomerase n=1 Tax=Brassica campestris TaxID=3711 RepID=A0A8D9CN56_BRACM|nr:unnamed protein product [Brassica rapa]
MIYATEKTQEVIISQSVRERNCEDRISALPDDLLVKILLFVPTKNIVTTVILSKRWRTIWTEVPRLEYEDIVSNINSEQKSVWWFLEKSLQLHKAPILESLCIQLKEICPTNVDVAKLVAQAVDRSLRRLLFHLSWLAKPTSMPNRLYTCETLTEMELFNKIILDVPPSVCLPSLAKLFLFCVVYKDDVSLVRLLSNCPVLRILLVIRSEEDGNVKKYTVKVPSLEEFTYLYKRPLSLAENTRSLVLDCPALTKLSINDHSGDSCSIGNMPSIVRAELSTFCYPDKKILRHISSATSLSLTLTEELVVMCRPDNFSQLVDLTITPCDSGWLEQLMLMLKSNNELQSLTIKSGHVEDINKTHLRDLMSDAHRCESMMLEFEGLLLDYSRQRATVETMDKLLNLAKAAQLPEKISRMFNGEHINSTENRSVLHVALRAPKDAVIKADGKNVVPEVWNVLDKIKDFSEKIRSGSWVGATGKPLKDVIAIGIGGSFLGPLFVHTALQTDPEAAECAKGRQLRFLANIDPVDVARNINGLNPETTLVVVVSKTFTTAETMLNARTLRNWITTALGAPAVAKHMVAVSTNLALVEKFGIDPNNAFAFWDWVGGRYSVCSAVGVLPLSLQYGFSVVEKFLKGASSIDQHFQSTPFEKNIPVILALLSVWNVSFLGYPARAILPYSQALEKFAPHIQQACELSTFMYLCNIQLAYVSMESNGKGVSIDGLPLPFETGEIDFGEPGTNGQHSFYQLIHQGRVIPCDFIGTVKSQQPVYLEGEVVSNHDELMSNFFAQPDALAYGKTPEQLQKENVSENLIPHKTFSGNRPSLSLLLPELSAYNVGQLLAIYEHRVAVQGFVWGINSFDQWGVELGKVLATQVRKQLHSSRTQGAAPEGFNYSTTTLLKRYLEVNIAFSVVFIGFSSPYD